MSHELIDPFRLSRASSGSADADPYPDLGILPAASKVALTLRVRRMTKRRAWHHAERDDYDERPAVGNRGSTGILPVMQCDAPRRPVPNLTCAQQVSPFKDFGRAAPQGRFGGQATTGSCLVSALVFSPKIDIFISVPITPAITEVPLATDPHGVVRVGGTRVTLDSVVGAFRSGATPEEIAQQFPALALADVYQVIAYFLHDTAEVEAYLSARQQDAASVRCKIESRLDPRGLRERLLARRTATVA